MKQRIYIHPLVARGRMIRLLLEQRAWEDRVINGTGFLSAGVIIAPGGFLVTPTPPSPLSVQDLVDVRQAWLDAQYRKHLT